MGTFSDEELGMNLRITRRDFLNGAALAIGTSLLPRSMMFGSADGSEPQNHPGYSPPKSTGLRGSHPGAFEVAHSLRDGTFWSQAGKAADTGEHYDLVVVGGGISGLSAAYFFRQAAGSQAKLLVLENHDDFGGHAKRNEFNVGGRTLLGFGGTFAIESTEPYTPAGKALIKDLGIEVSRFAQLHDTRLYSSLGLQPAIFFNKENFGADRLVKNPFSLWGDSDASPAARANLWKHFNADAPLNDKPKADLKRLYSLSDDLLPGLTDTEKKTRLAKMSYADYLTSLVKADPQVIEVLRPIIHAWYGVGIEAVPAQDAWGIGLPGFDGLELAPSPGPGMGRDAIRWNQEAKDYFFHFPDGNASVARLLVRNLIPAAIPGNTADDVVTAQVDYSKLDQTNSHVRIRLNSTAVRVRHLGEVSTAKEVEVSYVEQGKLCTVRAAHCVLACWNSMIPYLSTELPDKQAQAMASAEKVPLVYTNVVIRNWESWVKLAVDSIYAPAGYFSYYSLDMPVSIGKYQCTKRPDEPIVIHMQRVPCAPGLPARVQHRTGRANLYATTFEVFERNIRELLLRSLGAGGFDAARDIAAITVNRWPHGYAYHYNSLYDSFWMDGGPLPCVIARQPHGRVAIANADSDAFAYTHVAIEQAHRAIDDLGIQVRAA